MRKCIHYFIPAGCVLGLALPANGSGRRRLFYLSCVILELTPILPLPAGQVRAGAPFRTGLLCQNQAMATMQTAMMIIKTFIILLSL